MNELCFKDLKIGKYFFFGGGSGLLTRLYRKTGEDTARCEAEVCAVKTPYIAELNKTREFLPYATIKAVQ